MSDEDKLTAIHSALVGTMDKPGLLEEFRNMKKRQDEDAGHTVIFRKQLEDSVAKIDKAVCAVAEKAEDNSRRISKLEGFKNRIMAYAAGIGIVGGTGGSTLLDKLFGKH